MEFDPTLLDALRSAAALVVLTGSGISAGSGIPTYRGNDATALWEKYDPQLLSTFAGFERDPAGVWAWHQELKRMMDAAQPNAGHLALADLARRVPQLTLFTQNIDSLHQRAGSPDVVELHGTLARTICSRDGHAVTDWDPQASPPLCPDCAAPLRPAVVWFGELLDAAVLQRARDAFDQCDLALLVGTSSLVEPVSMLPHRTLRRGRKVLEINPDIPLRGIATWSLAERAEVALPALLAAAWPA